MQYTIFFWAFTILNIIYEQAMKLMHKSKGKKPCIGILK
jgi:hypothetical protein